MIPASSRWKAVAVAALLLASAGAGVAAVVQDAPSDDRPASASSSTPDPGADDGSEGGSPGPASAATADVSSLSPDDFEGQVLERFTGSLEAQPSTGTLDFRIDRGPVRVVGWERSSYEVLVLQENASDGQKVHDYETKTTWEDKSSGDAVDLTLTVEREGSYGVGLQSQAGSTENPYPHRAIVAFVPAGASYDEVVACSGEDHAFEQAWESSWRQVWPWSDRDVDGDDACLGTESDVDAAVHVDARPREDENDADEPAFNLTTGLVGLSGSTLRVASGHGDVALEAPNFTSLSVIAGHGDVTVRDMASDNATLLSGHGDVVAPGASGADLTAFTEHGAVAAGFTPDAPGQLDLRSEHGDVSLQVAPPDPAAYDLLGGTDHGDVDVSVATASVEKVGEDGNTSWQNPGYYTKWLEEDESYEHVKEGRTANWEDTQLQVEVTAVTDHGDVLVTDGSGSVVDFSDVGDDEEEDEDA